MHYLDIVLIIALLAFFISGIRKGLVVSLLQLFSIIFIYIAIRQAGLPLAFELHSRLGLNFTLATIISYILIIVLVFLLIKLVGYLVRKFLQLILLGWLDKLLGAVFNTAFGFLIIVLLILFLEVTAVAGYLGENRNRSHIYRTANSWSRDIRVNILERIPVKGTEKTEVKPV